MYERSCLCENSSDSCFPPEQSVGDVQCCYIKSTWLELAPSAREDKTLIQHPSRMAMAEARPLNRLDSARSNLKLSARNSSSIEKMRSIPKDGSMTPGVKAFTVTSSAGSQAVRILTGTQKSPSHCSPKMVELFTV